MEADCWPFFFFHHKDTKVSDVDAILNFVAPFAGANSFSIFGSNRDSYGNGLYLVVHGVVLGVTAILPRASQSGVSAARCATAVPMVSAYL